MIGYLKFLFQSTLTALTISLLIHHVIRTPDTASALPDCSKIKTSSFESQPEFYPFYLCEHTKPTTKLFHFLGTFNALATLASLGPAPSALARGLAQGYGFAWVSHFFVELNRPATFKYPVFSFFGDFVLFRDLLVGKYPMYEH